MCEINSLKKNISEFNKAKQVFELYETFYLGMSPTAKKYLKQQSAKYKELLLDIQEIILPYVKKVCPKCKIQCCKLHTPELSINISDSVGCFGCVDYLLIRCDSDLPIPKYENAEKNLCPFFSKGCILPADCRSYLCIRYFCDELEKEIDMEKVSRHLQKLKSLIDNFSIEKCMR